MRLSILVAAAALSAALISMPAAAQEAPGGGPPLPANALPQQVLELTQRVESLEASNAALHSALGALLACLAADSGPGRLVLRGCDLAVERAADGAGGHGDVEIEGVLRLNEVAARTDATDPRSDTLRIDAAQDLVLVSPDAVLLNAGGSELLLRSDGDVTLEGGDVQVRASSRIELQAPVLVVP